MEVDVFIETSVNKKYVQSRGSHIYHREIVAKNYDQNYIRNFQKARFERLIHQILVNHYDHKWSDLRIFEGGIGTGLFSIPIISHILALDSRSSFVGIDNSNAMLKVLLNKEEFQLLQTMGADRVSVGYGDLEEQSDYPNTDFNVLVFGGVLHCLTNEYFFLKHLDRVLENNGLLIMAFKTDSYTHLQCGARFTDLISDAQYGNFWRYYHMLRSSYNVPADLRCKFIYDVYFIHNLIQIQFNNRYILQKRYQIPWTSITSFEKMVFAIEHGLTFATGQGVPQEICCKLGEEMRGWVACNNLENREIDITHQMEVVVWKKVR